MNVILKIETSMGSTDREETFKLEDNMKNINDLDKLALNFVCDASDRSAEMEESMYMDKCYVTLGVEGIHISKRV